MTTAKTARLRVSAETWNAPQRYVAAQLRKPTGRFGRWVMTRGLNLGNAELITSTLDALALQKTDTFLDLGFGGGRGLALAAQRTEAPLWGVDYAGDMVFAAANRFESLIRSGRLNLLCADVAALPVRDALFDAICTTNTIYFWPDPARALLSLRKSLKDEGRLAIGYSGAQKMQQYPAITNHGFRLYQPKEVEPLLAAAGFTRVHTLTLTGRHTRGDFVTIAIP